MKIVIFGSTGMLGTYCMKYFKQQGYNVVGVDRKMLNLTSDAKTIYNFLYENVSEEDIIINASGIIKQRNASIYDMVVVNSAFPHILSMFKKQRNCNIFHITTDCVFSGEKGEYYEDDPHDCDDEYGKSKSLGEPKNLTIIRTSIIGEENNNKLSLIEWCKSMFGKYINGYANHYWNGVTCLELCNYINSVIIDGSFWTEVKHVFSEDTTKHDLIYKISEIYKLDLKIIPDYSGYYCNRTLRSIYDFSILEKSLSQQLIELKEYNIYE